MVVMVAVVVVNLVISSLGIQHLRALQGQQVAQQQF
jgi:hypothetical protein